MNSCFSNGPQAGRMIWVSFMLFFLFPLGFQYDWAMVCIFSRGRPKSNMTYCSVVMLFISGDLWKLRRKKFTSKRGLRFLFLNSWFWSSTLCFRPALFLGLFVTCSMMEEHTSSGLLNVVTIMKPTQFSMLFHCNNSNGSWWHTPVIPLLGKWRQREQKFNVILICSRVWGQSGICETQSPCQKNFLVATFVQYNVVSRKSVYFKIWSSGIDWTILLILVLWRKYLAITLIMQNIYRSKVQLSWWHEPGIIISYN